MARGIKLVLRIWRAMRPWRWSTARTIFLCGFGLAKRSTWLEPSLISPHLLSRGKARTGKAARSSTCRENRVRSRPRVASQNRARARSASHRLRLSWRGAEFAVDVRRHDAQHRARRADHLATFNARIAPVIAFASTLRPNRTVSHFLVGLYSKTRFARIIVLRTSHFCGLKNNCVPSVRVQSSSTTGISFCRTGSVETYARDVTMRIDHSHFVKTLATPMATFCEARLLDGHTRPTISLSGRERDTRTAFWSPR
jgi:hypothetical protein